MSRSGNFQEGLRDHCNYVKGTPRFDGAVGCCASGIIAAAALRGGARDIAHQAYSLSVSVSLSLPLPSIMKLINLSLKAE